MTAFGPLRPGDTIGIIGAGQLGRMLASAAARLGLRAHVFAPESGPAFDVCAARTLGDYDDASALSAFAESCAVVTYEFENIPANIVDFIGARSPVRPGREALVKTQDRLAEKDFVRSVGAATTRYVQVDNKLDLDRAIAALGRPAVLKTRRFGYDGKGQVVIAERDDPSAAFDALGRVPAILEAWTPFSREISVVAARGSNGDFAAFDVCENIHERHILAETRVPARVTDSTAQKAVDIARDIAHALDYIGALAVEMFVIDGDDPASETLLVNEIAPRVHNSGHWTIDGAETSQFEQHIRAIAGWPLGSARRRGDIRMRNLIGADIEAWRNLLSESGAFVHIYGKHDARPGRKMGHVTRIV